MSDRRNPVLDQLALGKCCPTCGAEPDDPCHVGQSTTPRPPHVSRIKRARREWERIADRRAREANEQRGEPS